MEEFPKIKPPVGRIRHIMGIALLTFGVVISVRAGWLGVFYGPGFGHDEWVRFAFYVWLGAVLALTGCWMVYRSRAAAGGAVLATAVALVLVYAHDRWLR